MFPLTVIESCENWFVMVNSPFNTGQDWEKITNTLRSNILSKLERIFKRKYFQKHS